MLQIGAFQWPAIERDASHIGMGIVQRVGDDGEALAIGEVKRGAGQERAAEHVLIAARRDRVEAERGEHVPR